MKLDKKSEEETTATAPNRHTPAGSYGISDFMTQSTPKNCEMPRLSIKGGNYIKSPVDTL